MKEFDTSKEITSGPFLDFNSIYAQVLSEQLPVGSLYEFNKSKIESFSVENINLNGEQAYFLLLDFEIPDNAKQN